MHEILYDADERAHMIQAIDFFCGGGGMTYGLREAGVEVIAGVDLARDCETTYESNNAGSRFVCADIKELPLDFFENEFGIRRNDDELLLVGCSPCQYYSIINTTREKSKLSKDLLLDFMRFVEFYNPGFVLVENVPGLLSREDSAFPEFLEFLNAHDFHVIYDIVNMSYYGVPQTRRRFSLVASRLGDVRMPEKDARQKLLSEFIGTKRGLKSIPAGHTDSSEFMHSTMRLAPINMKRLLRTSKNGGSRMEWKDDEELQLKCYIGKDNSFRDVYGRLRWDRPSSTITTNFIKISSGRFAHPCENRGLSIREGAKLQTFPDSYIFKGGNMAINARIIGNAVPPEYARRLGELLITLQHEYNG